MLNDGKTLVSGSWVKNIKLWDINTGNLIKTIKGNSIVYCLTVLKSNGWIGNYSKKLD